jgi:uncharacterized protein YcbX
MSELGTVAALHRYPVKSMLGESLEAVQITASGFVGDRAFALIDVETGRVASAKHPKAWRALLTMRSRWDGGAPQITLPDDSILAATEDAGPVEIGQGTPGANFVDYAPLHIVTTSTLAYVGVDAAR